MFVKSVKTALQGTVRSVGDWAAQGSAQVDSLVERWKVFEQEMDAARTTKDGPLRWEAPRRNKDENETLCSPPVVNASETQTAASVQSAAQVQPTVAVTPPPTVAAAPPPTSEVLGKVKPAIKETKTRMDLEPATEEGRAELAKFLKKHHKDVEVRREAMMKQLDRIACRNLPKLERHMMVNPQKLYTPQTKVKFKTAPSVPVPRNVAVPVTPMPKMVPTMVQVKATSPAEEAVKKMNPTPAVVSDDMKRKTMTKLAAWSKSKEPPSPEPPKPPPTPTVLKVLTTKQNSPTSQLASSTPIANASPLSTSAPSPTPLPTLIERLAASGGSKSPETQSYASDSSYQLNSMPTQYSNRWNHPKNRGNMKKQPMSFESSLSSVERMIDLTLTQTSNQSVSLQ